MNKPYIHGMLPDVAANAKAPPAAAEQPQIRYVGDMQRLQPQPGDVFVLTCEQRIDSATAERIKAEISGVLGGAKVLVLDGGLKLGVVASSSAFDLGVAADETTICILDGVQIGNVLTGDHRGAQLLTGLIRPRLIENSTS